MKQLKNLFELLTRLPLLRIVKNALFGAFGIAPALGIVTQIVLQSAIVISADNFRLVPSRIVIVSLCMAHFFVGILVALQEVECFSKPPRIRGELKFLIRTFLLSLLIGGGFTALLVGLASLLFTPLSLADYGHLVIYSSVAAFTVHVGSLVVPYSLARRLQDLEADDQNGLP